MSKKNKIGKCRLCNNTGQLCNSHILPKFIYKKIKGRKTDFLVLSDDPEKRKYKSQKEYREYLLCANCEKKLNRYETYICNVLYNSKKFYDKDGEIVKVYNIDYNKFKLFQLSILWRGSVTSSPVFENGKINIGDEENIRQMLLNENPGDEFEYGCRMFGLLLNGKMEIQFMMNPAYMFIDNYKIVYYTFGGFRWNFIVSKMSKRVPKDLYSITINGELIYKLVDMMNIPDISDIFKKHIKN
jgi:phage pi2 protein 07